MYCFGFLNFDDYGGMLLFLMYIYNRWREYIDVVDVVVFGRDSIVLICLVRVGRVFE